MFYDAGRTVTGEGTAALVSGTWYHAAVTWDGTTVRLYLNGVEEDNWAERSLSTPSADTFQIGCHSSGFRHFDGVLDDVRLHSRALCADEVAAVYQNVRTPRIVGWREIDPNQ